MVSREGEIFCQNRKGGLFQKTKTACAKSWRLERLLSTGRAEPRNNCLEYKRRGVGMVVKRVQREAEARL